MPSVPTTLNDSRNIRILYCEVSLMKLVNLLSVLLAISVLLNVGFFVVYNPYEQGRISDLIARTSALSTQNMELQKQIGEVNMSLQNSESQLNFYRTRLPGSDPGGFFASGRETGSASIRAPAVSQSVQYVRNGPFLMQNVISNGSIMNITVDVQPGKGRVLVETKPLMGIVFQDAANTAVFVAQNRTGADISGSDFLFSIEADKQISSVDGPSAGALMTLLAIAALENRTINPSVTLTGTIREDGHIGAIGGAVEKAEAAKENGLTMFLMPLDNQALTIFSEQTVNYGGFQLVEQIPQTVPAKGYIENSTGIRVTYVNSIDDVIAASLQ
jgi:hypothetical protein